MSIGENIGRSNIRSGSYERAVRHYLAALRHQASPRRRRATGRAGDPVAPARREDPQLVDDVVEVLPSHDLPHDDIEQP
jgi:hypothetical protein